MLECTMVLDSASSQRIKSESTITYTAVQLNAISISDYVRIVCSNTTGITLEQEVLTLPEHMCSTPVFSGVRAAQSLVFCGVFCRSLFVILSFLFWPLYCLSFFDLRFLTTHLVSSAFSYGGYCCLFYLYGFRSYFNFVVWGRCVCRSNGSWIYNYLCNQCLSAETFFVSSNPTQTWCSRCNNI